jgi:hypothetical protein
MALGVWVGNSRAFELIYALFWYIGVVNQVPAFDYAGATAEGLSVGIPVVCLGSPPGWWCWPWWGDRDRFGVDSKQTELHRVIGRGGGYPPKSRTI